MKLDSIDSFVVGNPNPGIGGRYFIFIKLTTQCGISGYGEIYNASFGPHLVAAMAEEVFAQEMAGEDPFQIEKIWRRVYSRGFSQRPDITLMGVLSGLEIACWDIIGKATASLSIICLAANCITGLEAIAIFIRPKMQTQKHSMLTLMRRQK